MNIKGGKVRKGREMPTAMSPVLILNIWFAYTAARSAAVIRKWFFSAPSCPADYPYAFFEAWNLQI